MNTRQLKHFVSNIESKKAINLSKFNLFLKSLSLDESNYATKLQATKMKGSLYLVTQIDQKLISDLKTLLSTINTSRNKAATQNRSHSSKVNGSFLISRFGYSDPCIIMIDEDGGFELTCAQAHTALIIENRLNFISIKKSISFLEKYTKFKFSESIHIFFAEGNEISNSLHRKFLMQYRKVYLFLDLDLGGLSIARNLMKLLPESAFDFLLPFDIEKRLKNVVEVRDKEYIEKVIKISNKNAHLASVARLITDHRKTLEQESYLNDE